MSTNERPTPETDAYKGTHETHRISGKTIYDHAEHLERQRDEARDRIAQLEKQLAELQKPKEPETFKFYFRTWIKHMPGDPMPCEANANVRVLFACEQQGSSDYCHGTSFAERWDWSNKIDPLVQITGWNYADAP